MGAVIGLLVVAGCAWGGWAIGKGKDRGTLGLVLGLFLGLIGIVIIAVIPAKKKAVPFNDPYRSHVTPPGFRDTSGWTSTMAPPLPPLPPDYTRAQPVLRETPPPLKDEPSAEPDWSQLKP